jgi:hypothetical protein
VAFAGHSAAEVNNYISPIVQNERLTEIANSWVEHVVEPSGKFDALTFVVVAVAPTDDLAQSLLDSASRTIDKLLI